MTLLANRESEWKLGAVEDYVESGLVCSGLLQVDLHGRSDL